MRVLGFFKKLNYIKPIDKGATDPSNESLHEIRDHMTRG